MLSTHCTSPKRDWQSQSALHKTECHAGRSTARQVAITANVKAVYYQRTRDARPIAYATIASNGPMSSLPCARCAALPVLCQMVNWRKYNASSWRTSLQSCALKGKGLTARHTTPASSANRQVLALNVRKARGAPSAGETMTTTMTAQLSGSACPRPLAPAAPALVPPRVRLRHQLLRCLLLLLLLPLLRVHLLLHQLLRPLTLLLLRPNHLLNRRSPTTGLPHPVLLLQRLLVMRHSAKTHHR